MVARALGWLMVHPPNTAAAAAANPLAVLPLSFFAYRPLQACQRNTAGVAPRQTLAAASAVRQQQAAAHKRRQLCRVEAASAGEGMSVAKPSLMSPNWQQVVDLKKENATIETSIKAVNKSGGCCRQT